MTQPVPRAAYVAHINALLPPGRAWDPSPGSTLAGLIDGYAEELARFDFDATALLIDMLPSSTTQLIAEWETAVGIPDDCSALGANLQQRRAAVRTKLNRPETVGPDFYQAIGDLFGVTVTIEEQDRARAQGSSMLDTGNGRWRYVWWIEIPASGDDRAFTTLSDVLEPLSFVERNLELECRLRNLVPLHTELFIEYV